MTVDAFLPPRRPWRLGVAIFVLAVAALGGAALVAKHPWSEKPVPVATALPASKPIDPIETGSVAAGDAIGDMIQNLDAKGAPRPR
jgi:hypothetical protein